MRETNFASVCKASLSQLCEQGLRGDIGSTVVVCKHNDAEYYVRLHFQRKGLTMMYDGRSFYPMEVPTNPASDIKVVLEKNWCANDELSRYGCMPNMVSVGRRSGVVLIGDDPFATCYMAKAHLSAVLRDVLQYDMCCERTAEAGLIDDVMSHMPTAIERLSAVILTAQSRLVTLLLEELRRVTTADFLSDLFELRCSRSLGVQSKTLEVI